MEFAQSSPTASRRPDCSCFGTPWSPSSSRSHLRSRRRCSASLVIEKVLPAALGVTLQPRIACEACARPSPRLRQDAEPLALDPERYIKLAAEVLQRDGGRQLHDLRLVEEGPDPREELVRDALAGDRHGLRVLERRPLHLRKPAALPPRRHLADLVLVRPGLHPPGCVDVDSEGASVDERDAEVDERHEGDRQPPRLLDGGGELLGRLHDRRAMGEDFGRVEEVTEELPLFGEALLQDRIAAVVLDLAHSRHGLYLIRAAWSARSMAFASSPAKSRLTGA